MAFSTTYLYKKTVKSYFLLKILITLSLFSSFQSFSQHPGDFNLLIADKKFIRADYAGASAIYLKHLRKHEGDFYTTRQIAICYSRMYDHDKAIDYWTPIYEHGKAVDKDRMEYAKCLLANYRIDEAKRVLYELRGSSDPVVTAWSRAYANPTFFTEDSALMKVYPLNGFATEEHESNPTLYKSELIYITAKDKSFIKRIFDFKKKKSEIFSAEKTDSVTWKKGKIFNAEIQRNKINGSVAFTPDDSVMYFTSCFTKGEMKKAGFPDGTPMLKIFYTEINTNGYAHPEIKPFQYNSTSYNTAYPTIDHTGKKIFFASDMPGSLGGYDIWMCEKKEGKWTTPVNLGPTVNSSGNEIAPFITQQGVLYYASDGKPGMGGLDIFFSDPSGAENTFIEAENAGSGLNSQFNDFGVYLLKDGKRGYFSSNRKNGLKDNDIYYFVNNHPASFYTRILAVDSVEKNSVGAEVSLVTPNGTIGQAIDSGGYFRTRFKAGKEINLTANSANYFTKIIRRNATESDSVLVVEMCPRSQKCIAGKIMDRELNQPIAGVKVAIYDEDGNKYLDAVTDETGVYRACKLPLDKDLYIGAEKRPDYFTNTERFKLAKGTDIEKDLFTQKIVIGKAIKIENIYFDAGKWDVRQDAAVELDKLVNLMKANPDIVIELDSHTDCNGSDSQNMVLSDKRAKSSAAYIVSKGVSQNRIKGKGMGETQLIKKCKCETCTEDDHAANRRTEFKVTGFTNKK